MLYLCFLYIFVCQNIVCLECLVFSLWPHFDGKTMQDVWQIWVSFSYRLFITNASETTVVSTWKIFTVWCLNYDELHGSMIGDDLVCFKNASDVKQLFILPICSTFYFVLYKIIFYNRLFLLSVFVCMSVKRRVVRLHMLKHPIFGCLLGSINLYIFLLSWFVQQHRILSSANSSVLPIPLLPVFVSLRCYFSRLFWNHFTSISCITFTGKNLIFMEVEH